MVAEEVDPLADVRDARQLLQPERERVRALLGEGQEEITVEDEVEQRLELVAAAEVVGEGAQPDVDLAEQDGVAAADLGELLEQPQELVRPLQAARLTRQFDGEVIGGEGEDQ